MDNERKHYIPLGGRLRPAYAYVDLNVNSDYVADSLFFKRKIRVRFKNEYSRDGEKYRMVFCSVKKKDQKAFEEALEEIPVKMELLGHLDYREYCETLIKDMGIWESGKKENG